MARNATDGLLNLLRAGGRMTEYEGRTEVLTGWNTLAGLPARLRCHTLVWHGFPGRAWPRDWVVTHKLDLTNAPHLAELPTGLRTRVLTLAHCPSLERLPEDLEVDFLDVSHGRSLRHWPDSARVAVGFATARECVSLTRLPATLGPLSGLDLRGCRLLRSLPDGLRVSSWIDVARTGLTSLPESLRGVGLRWNGVAISPQVAFFPETISAAAALAEPNAEVRRVLVERMGFERFLAEAGAEVLDRDTDPGGERQLLRVKLGSDEPLVCVSVRCPSTGRHYLIRVPPQMQTCHQAVAWTAGFDDPNDYRPVQET